MPEVSFSIGGREFSVACQPGEEALLTQAAGLLDAEAATLLGQVGRLPESRMLLMAGLMLADRTAEIQERLSRAESELARLKANPPKVEVPVIPRALVESLAEMAARAEAVADRLEADPA